MLTVLYDGWPLVTQPNRPAGLHLAALLAQPHRQVRAVVALPGAPFEPLADGVEAHVIPTPASERGRIAWTQRRLPRLARQVGASLIHLTGGGQALFAAPNSVLSPCDPVEPPRPVGFAARLRVALDQGGLARLRGVFWPDDLPAPHLPNRLIRLPELVPPHFLTPAAAAEPEADLPGDYVLAHLQGSANELPDLLAIWQRVAAALGAAYTLVIAGAGKADPEERMHLLQEFGLDEKVHFAPNVRLAELAALYQHCAALLHPGEAPGWGSAVRLALAAGRPVVALETPRLDALVGPAAYLAPPGEHAHRALAAALITVLVDETVAENLSMAAHQRAQSWLAGGQNEQAAELLRLAYLAV